MNIYDVDLATFEEAVKTLPYQSNAFLYIYPTMEIPCLIY